MKKLNKLIAVVIALAVMAMMCAVSAFAVTDEEKVGTPETAVITKYLKLPSGVTIPNKTFTFVVTPSTGAPADAIVTTADYDINTSEMQASGSPADGSSLVGTLDIADWFDTTKFPTAGKYTYTVVEDVADEIKANEYKEQVGDTADEVLVYSQAEYTLDLYVTNNADGTKAIDKIVATDEEGNKVDVNDTDPTDPNATEDNVTDANAEGATFVNDYQNLGNTPDDPTEVDPTNDDYGDLGIKKVVTGTYGDYSAPFKFNVTVNKPATGYPVDTVEAYIYTGSTKGEKVTFTFETEKEVRLASGQALAFINLPEGATYAVEENLAGSNDVVTPGDYRASYEVKTTPATGEATTKTSEQAAAGANLAVAAGDKAEIANANKANTVTYTNDSQIPDTPTGILMNNLPYIVLALVAIGGLCAYVIVRRKNEDNA